MGEELRPAVRPAGYGGRNGDTAASPAHCSVGPIREIENGEHDGPFLVLPRSGLVRSGSSPVSVRESNQSGPGLDRSLTGPCSLDSADRLGVGDCSAYLFWAWHEQPIQQTMHGL